MLSVHESRMCPQTFVLPLKSRKSHKKKCHEMKRIQILAILSLWLLSASLNYYNQWGPQPADFSDWAQWADKPVLLTEWYAKAMDVPSTARRTR